MGFLSSLRTYAQSWSETARAKFSKSEIKEVEKATVVESEYGLSACFFMKSGGRKYMPLSRDVEAEIGDTIDIADAEVITLSREGDDDIYRLDY